MSFDRVELHRPDEASSTLTPEQFRALPALDRVQWIGKGYFHFYLAEQRVRAVDALRAARQTA